MINFWSYEKEYKEYRSQFLNIIDKTFKKGQIFFGKNLINFENNFKNKYKSKYGLAVGSGTDALLISLMSLGIKRGDEVITASNTAIPTISAIVNSGAKPVLVDIDENYLMDIKKLKKSISNKTKAIIPVHMLGVPAQMDEILKIAKKNKIKVLEDNCEAVGAKLNNKYLGSIGDIGVASYDFSKTITCGEGGMIFTNNKKIFKYCKEYHDHGHENNPKLKRGEDSRSIVGFNYRMTELQAVVGKVQLKKIDFILKENKKRYLEIEKVLKKNTN